MDESATELQSGQCEKFPAETMRTGSEQELAARNRTHIIYDVLANAEMLLSETSPNVSFGTVWRVKESLWKECVPNYDKNSTREQHPGVSILRLPFSLSVIGGYIPMLHGSSEESAKRGSEDWAKPDFFYARGLSAERGDEYCTFFGHIGPAKLPVEQLSGIPLPEDSSEIDLDWEFDYRRIRPNTHKRKLSRGEKAFLVKWLSRKRLG